MRKVSISVGPQPGGWSLDCDYPLQPAFFSSGMRAERAAKDLAARISSAGCDVKLVIHDKARNPVVSHRYIGF